MIGAALTLLRSLALLAALVLAAPTASAQMPGAMPVLGGAAPKLLTFVGSETNSGSCTSPCTFNNAGSHYNIGPAAPDRRVHGVFWGQGSGLTLSSVTICGVSGTLNVAGTLANEPFSIYTASVPTGTTCDGVGTYSGNPGRSGFSIYYSTGLSSSTASSTQNNSACASMPTACSATVTALAGGFVIAAASYQNCSNIVWSVVAKDFFVNVGAGAMCVSSGKASNTAAGSFSPNYTDTVGVAPGNIVAAF